METQHLLAEQRDTIELLIGAEASDQLYDVKFLMSWDSLCHSCTWATVFQRKEFVITWYEQYGRQYIPIIVKSYHDGKLTGLLTLAKNVKRLTIGGAGTTNAEYQTWLSTPEHTDHFIWMALSALGKKFPDHIIHLRYLPSNTPLEWLHKDSRWKFKSVLRVLNQPLITIDENHFDQKLTAKTIREKTKRLKKQGELKIERITDSEHFSRIFDEIAMQFEFRKSAMYNKEPFKDDPLMKGFLLELFNKNILHVTILKLDDRIIAATINTGTGKWLHLKGINTHAPFFAKQSPGLLHFLMLGKLLAAEGVEVFDLTPGGDYYKEALATNHASVYELWIINKMQTYMKVAFTEQIKRMIRNTLTSRGIDPHTFKTNSLKAHEKLRFVKQRGIVSFMKYVTIRVMVKKKQLAFAIKPVIQGTATHSLQINKNNLSDLLQFHQKSSDLNKWEFLAQAMKRFELGEQAYTLTNSGKLVACAWMRSKGRPLISGLNTTVEVPAEASVLQGLYFHPDEPERFPAFLGAVAREISTSLKTDEIWVIADGRDTALCRLLKKKFA